MATGKPIGVAAGAAGQVDPWRVIAGNDHVTHRSAAGRGRRTPPGIDTCGSSVAEAVTRDLVETVARLRARAAVVRSRPYDPVVVHRRMDRNVVIRSPARHDALV